MKSWLMQMWALLIINTCLAQPTKLDFQQLPKGKGMHPINTEIKKMLPPSLIPANAESNFHTFNEFWSNKHVQWRECLILIFLHIMIHQVMKHKLLPA